MGEKNHDVAVYGGYICEDDKLMQSASGGMATALAEQMIEAGGYVAGIAYSENFHKAEYLLTNNKCDLEKLRGSKYVETVKNNIYKRVKDLLDQEEKVLFIGLPCVVATLYKTLKNRPQNLLTCELICHGPTSAKVHEEYVLYLEKKYHSKIVEFSVRHKKYGWQPSYLYAKFSNGQEFEELFSSTEYGQAFSILGRESCYNCKFRGNNRCADIMVGDFWGATEQDDFWNKKGVSVIFAETEKGEEALKKLRKVRLYPTTFERAVAKNPMVIQSKERSPYREKFLRLLESRGLFYAARHSQGMKHYVKTLLAGCLPRSVILSLKKAMGRQ